MLYNSEDWGGGYTSFDTFIEKVLRERGLCKENGIQSQIII